MACTRFGLTISSGLPAIRELSSSGSSRGAKLNQPRGWPTGGTDLACAFRELKLEQRDGLICYKASKYGSTGRHTRIVDHFHWQSRLAMTHRTEENNSTCHAK